MIRRHDLIAGGVALLGCVLAACGDGAKPPSGLTYRTDPATYTRGIAIAPNTPSYEGGPVTAFDASPPLPAGLSLDAATGVITGTPTTVSAPSRFTIRASNARGRTETTLTIGVNDAAPGALSYAANPAIYARGVAIPPNVPAHGGGVPDAYGVVPALPAGLDLDPASGVITGTPTVVTAAATFEVRASNAAGSTTTSLTITVNESAPADLAYETSDAVYTRGVPIAANRPVNAGGVATSYEVAPDLPAGLVVDPATGVITGTPELVAAAASYEVRASNDVGSSTTLLTITVNDVPPADLTYSAPGPIYIKGLAITPNRPASSGGVVTSYGVDPELPAGLVLDATTGVVSGTPEAVAPATAHVVTAGNSGGSTSTVLTITVTTLADASEAVVGDDVATATPFARHLLVNGNGFEKLRSVTFRIAPRQGTFSRPVSVTYGMPHMQRRGFIMSDHELKLQVFGLYAGVSNTIDLELDFTDGSTKTLSTDVIADPHRDGGVYTAPTIRSSRRAGDGLGFDYFWIKSGLGSPIVMDSDGNVRWAVPAEMGSMSSVLLDGAFFVGTGSVELTRLEFDGSMTTVPVKEPRYRNFHHDIAPGKSGLLAQVDGDSPAGVFHVETILAELSPEGDVLQEWDFTDIVSQEMRDGGDDPSAFVRESVDWFHVNSAEYVPEDDSLLVSSRENFVVKVDYATGAIRWLFGDPTKYWHTFPSLRRKALTLTEGLYPIGQHALSWPASGELMLFDNGYASLNNPPGTPAGEERPYSVVARYRIDEWLGTAEEIWSYDADRLIKSSICSSIYEATPGHHLITYSAVQGTTAKLIGLLPSGQRAFDFEFPSAFCNTSWNARPIALERFELLE